MNAPLWFIAGACWYLVSYYMFKEQMSWKFSVVPLIYWAVCAFKMVRELFR